MVGLVAELAGRRVGIVAPRPDEEDVARRVDAGLLPVGVVVRRPARALDETELAGAGEMHIRPGLRRDAVTVQEKIAVAGAALAEDVKQVAVRAG